MDIEMKHIFLLEENDIIQSDDWCRPLYLISMNGGYSDYYSFECHFSGTPINNTKWCQVKRIFGDNWNGKTVAEFRKTNDEFQKYEFVRGDIPLEHVVENTQSENKSLYKMYLDDTIMKLGKYKGKTLSKIKCTDERYFWWAIDNGLIESESIFIEKRGY